MKPHKYTKYRPAWCQHPPFESIDYCWGLAVAVDEKKLKSFYGQKCELCDFSKHFDKVKFDAMIFKAERKMIRKWMIDVERGRK